MGNYFDIILLLIVTNTHINHKHMLHNLLVRITQEGNTDAERRAQF